MTWAERYAGSGRASLVGRAFTVAPDVAALVNGTAGHSFELDDTHDVSMSHPGAVVFPAALAVAADVGATGREVLSAAAAGYETMARLGAAAGAGRVIARGFHPTALFGVFGAATTAARLLGLDGPGLTSAWGHALSLAGGSMQFSQESDGADVKRMHAGYAARNGVIAAQMAQAGIGAPARSLDGRYGFLALYGEDPRAEALDIEDGAILAIHDVSLKPYACNRLLHSMIDVLRELSDFALPREAVARLVVRGPRKLVDQHVVRRPRTTMAAQYSLPFTVGAVMTFGPEDFDAYDAAHLDHPAILAWADLVEVEADAALEASYPAHFGAEVELHLTNGEVRRMRLLDSQGTPRRPLSRSAIQAKARGLLRGRRPEVYENLAAAVAGLAGLAGIDGLRDALAASA